MAAYALTAIKKRAFKFNQTAVNAQGTAASALTDDYRYYKSGTRPYVSDKTRHLAQLRRDASGKPGMGPLVRVEGGAKQRLAPRSQLPDQVLSGGTQKALQVVEGVGTTDRRVIGFVTERARRIAAALEARNGQTVAVSDQELNRLQQIALEEAGITPDQIDIQSNVVITVRT